MKGETEQTEITLTEQQFICLRAAINLAREYQILKNKTLREKLLGHGFFEHDIDAAINYWKSISPQTAPCK